MQTTTTPTEMRQCTRCELVKPIEQFRLRRRGHPDRAGECRRCHADAERHRRQRKRSRKIVRVTRQLAESDDLEKIQQLASKMISQFGGPKRLANQYLRITESALASEFALPTAGTMLLGFLRLQILHESIRTNEPTPQRLEEMPATLKRELARFIVENPESTATVLAEVGWRVFPPDNLGGNDLPDGKMGG